MSPKISETKNLLKASNIDQHIPPIAGAIFAVFMIAITLGAILMDGKVSDGWIGAYITSLTIIGTYIMFALKVASQWQKAVVLRLGKFREIGRAHV
jgi:hypothetical protein